MFGVDCMPYLKFSFMLGALLVVTKFANPNLCF